MRAYLGLGSNLGDRRSNIHDALRRLNDTDGIRVTKVSSMYDTQPVGGPEQPDFLNAACEIETDLTPHELLRAALGVEDAMGRVRGERWGPRLIDIDILLMGETVVSDAALTLPHPRMTEREFVLRPLAEIAPAVRHPATQRDVREMLCAIEGASGRTTGR